MTDRAQVLRGSFYLSYRQQFYAARDSQRRTGVAVVWQRGAGTSTRTFYRTEPLSSVPHIGQITSVFTGRDQA